MGYSMGVKSKKEEKVHNALYGNTILLRTYCRRCKGFTFVQNNTKVCCGEQCENITNTKKRMSGCNRRRRQPSKKEQERILFYQNYKCLYCMHEFGDLYYKNGRVSSLKLNWDHYIPYAYSGYNDKSNFVASCNICNGIKGSKIFETIEDARNYILYQTQRRGIEYL
jgi:hypothetical protein